jgi:Asp/Glu/hydantoin racemase
MNVEQMQRDMVAVAKRLVSEHRDVGAIVFECTNMAPYAHAVQAAVGLPVFDIQALIRMVHRGLHQRRYVGQQ